METLKEAELLDVVDLIYNFIDNKTHLFNTLAKGKALWKDTSYRADIESLTNKAKLCYEHPGNEGFMKNGERVNLEDFKLLVFARLKYKFVKEHTRFVKCTDSELDNLFSLSFSYLALDPKLGATRFITVLFGNKFIDYAKSQITRSKAIAKEKAAQQKAVNESFERIYNRFN